MNIKTATYWGTTVLFALALGAAGVADLLLTPDMAAANEIIMAARAHWFDDEDTPPAEDTADEGDANVVEREGVSA